MVTLYSLHRQRYAMSTKIYFVYSHHYVLMEFYYFVRVANKTVGKLGDMHEAVLVNTYIHEYSEVGYVSHNTW